MDKAALLARFDAEMRIDPPPEPGVRHERTGGVVRTLGTRWAVVFAPATAVNATRAVAEQLAYFRSPAATAASGTVDPDGVWPAPEAIEWKVYGHDEPPDLAAHLAAADFEPGEQETLMIAGLPEMLRTGGASAGHPGGASVPAGVEIRRVTDAAGVADLVAVGAAAFGGRDTVDAVRAKRRARYTLRLSDPTMGLYVAYAGSRPVSAGRIDCPPGRSFAGLWGGGTIPAYRGRGIYRALVHIRVEEARRRGYRYLMVEARETSRPILERLGFIALTRVTEWKHRMD